MNIGGFTLHLARFESVGLGWDAWLDATLETNMNGIDPTVGKVLRPRILLKTGAKFSGSDFLVQNFSDQAFRIYMVYICNIECRLSIDDIRC